MNCLLAIGASGVAAPGRRIVFRASNKALRAFRPEGDIAFSGTPPAYESQLTNFKKTTIN
jgi:hypothetical protein